MCQYKPVKDLGTLVDDKLNMSAQGCAAACRGGYV